MQTQKYLSFCFFILLVLISQTPGLAAGKIWLMCGEVTENSAILQARINGVSGVQRGYFMYSQKPDFADTISVAVIAKPENDYILKTKIKGLSSNTKYYYCFVHEQSPGVKIKTKTQSFTTLQGASSEEDVSFVVVSCMQYERFTGLFDPEIGKLHPEPWLQPASPREIREGYPGFQVITRLKPDFWIGDGDNVYYDSPKFRKAKTQEELRAKWHDLYGFPRFQKMVETIPTYWLKDDHDYRFNDGDTTNEKASEPSHELGLSTFREQTPVTDPQNPDEKTYRTYRLNKHVQIWFPENRDYRSPISWQDGPEKTIWGKEQNEWIRRTLKESDATFKIFITPSPLVGPDDFRPPGDTITQDKKDNHADIGGYQYEANAFFAWLKENGFNSKNFIIITGDRHWQYHSIHPSGFHEFGTGAFVCQNARIGRKPGEKNSTDPDAKIVQPYIQDPPTGGFLQVNVTKNKKTGKNQVRIRVIKENGKLLYEKIFQQ